MELATPLDEEYFGWLYSVVEGSYANDDESRVEVLKNLHMTPFTWNVENDDNRASDGRDLRFEFRSYYMVSQQPWLDLECSVLEMIIGLANRMCFVSDGTVPGFFWEIMRNLGLDDISDSDYPNLTHMVDRIVDTLLTRKYRYDGYGGPFPLRHPNQDQRTVQLWDQMNAYVLENDPLYS